MTDGIDIWTRRASVVLLACCLETFLFAQALLHFYPLGPVTRVAWEVVGYGVSVPATPWIWSLLFGFRVRLFGLGTPLAAVSHGAARLAVAAREDRDPTPLLGTLAVAFNLTWTAANDTLMLFLGSIPWLHLDDIIPVIAFSTTFFALSSVLRLQLLIVPNRWLRADISSRHIPHELGEEILHRDRKCFPQARMRRRLVRQGRYYAFLYSRRRPVVLTVLFLATGASAAWLLATSRTIFATLGVQMGAVLAGVPPLVAALALCCALSPRVRRRTLRKLADTASVTGCGTLECKSGQCPSATSRRAVAILQAREAPKQTRLKGSTDVTLASSRGSVAI